MYSRLATVFFHSVLLIGFTAAHAQQADERDAFEPSVDTTDYAPEPAVDTSPDDEIAADTESEPAEPSSAEEYEPAVSTSDRQVASNGDVMDRMTLSRTEITGNQELPKVMYIVPWKKSDPGDLMGRPVNTLLDEVLAPVDREEFIRQVGFYNDLYASDEE